jgi:hypothetical protein
VADQGGHSIPPEVEDPLEVPAHEARAGEPPKCAERECVAHEVAHQGAGFMGLEDVGVMPEPVGPAHLDVLEAASGLPNLDARKPANRQPVESQAILDQGPGAHPDRLGGDDPEAKPRRRDRLEVAGVCEELEGLRGAQWQELLSHQRVSAHK